jgi:hypothetical protein
MSIQPLQWMALAGMLIAAAGCDSPTAAPPPSPGEARSSAVPPEANREGEPDGGVDTSASASTAEASAEAGATKSPTTEANGGVKLPEPDASGYIETTFDDLKFEMTKTELFDRSMLTPKVNALMGKKIRIRGYIFPTLRKTGLDRIVLVRDNMECCFGPGAALFDCILVTMAPGKTAEYTIRPVAVEGEIRLEELPGGPNGRPLAIYQMVGHKVE